MSDFIETREISDSDLDNVAGGVLGLDVSSVVSPVLGTVNGIAPVSSTVSEVTGLLPAQVTGPLGQVTGPLGL
jgi:hypothetical protein